MSMCCNTQIALLSRLAVAAACVQHLSLFVDQATAAPPELRHLHMHSCTGALRMRALLWRAKYGHPHRSDAAV